jgi:hypothetical protein
MFARALAASTGTSPHVTMFGEIAPILCRRGLIDEMIRVERMADEFAAARPMSVLCAYPTDCLNGGAADLMETVCREHSAIVPANL